MHPINLLLTTIHRRSTQTGFLARWARGLVHIFRGAEQMILLY